ncbi:LacI family transcriptional regulator [Domibacillus indicus]|uniref:LacI family DNA-binding transcriptional regulator n=1 Tax=Domibacillus indicus TaxID=1437523 RepID=UPI00204128EE|nr:LacI family DNA-binding transcriptional regulator [Domibacillus indicus]MCM3790592.1 LacI family transcriptional regulator [Domibacillus indicus]
MRVTIKDIAAVCGVSAGTVDRALNNRTGISEKTRNKVLKAAKEMNYQPDFTARSLVMGRTMTLGVVLFDLYNRSFAQLMNAIEQKSRELGYFVYITLTDKDPENERTCIEYLINRKVDGIILFTVNQGEEFDDYLSRFHTPIVTIFNFISNNWEYIGIRERLAMKEAVNYIASKDYKRFVYVSPPLAYAGKTNIYTQEERFIGFLEGIKLNNAPEPLVLKDSDYLNKLQAYAFDPAEKTAIVCSTDLYALEVMNLLKERSIAIPEQAGVMGFDDIDMLKYISPRLTTVKFPIVQIGEKAVESIVNKIEKGAYISIPLLDHEIIRGESI